MTGEPSGATTYQIDSSSSSSSSSALFEDKHEDENDLPGACHECLWCQTCAADLFCDAAN